jgi:site-specific recombinase XerD
LLDAGADLATVQKMVGHESVTTAGYDRRGDATRRKAADLVHVPFFPRQQD